MQLIYLRQAVVFVLCVYVLAACSESTSEGVATADLFPRWSLSVDKEQRMVSASARVFNFDQPNVTFASLSGSDIRLVKGDVFRIAWSDQSWQLYRREAEYVYRREFQIPAGFDSFEARLDRKNGASPSKVIEVVLPTVDSLQLTEEGLTLEDSATLNLSWSLDTSVVPVENQSLVAELISCSNQTVNKQRETLSLSSEQRTRSVLFNELPQPNAVANECLFGFQLEVETRHDSPRSLELSTMSEQRTVTVRSDYTGGG